MQAKANRNHNKSCKKQPQGYQPWRLSSLYLKQELAAAAGKSPAYPPADRHDCPQSLIFLLYHLTLLPPGMGVFFRSEGYKVLSLLAGGGFLYSLTQFNRSKHICQSFPVSPKAGCCTPSPAFGCSASENAPRSGRPHFLPAQISTESRSPQWTVPDQMVSEDWEIKFRDCSERQTY